MLKIASQIKNDKSKTCIKHMKVGQGHLSNSNSIKSNNSTNNIFLYDY